MTFRKSCVDRTGQSYLNMGTPINLDDLTAAELRHAWEDWKDAEDQPTRLLAAYAIHKSLALESRAGGNICAAGLYDVMCEQTYEALPEQLRW